MHKLPIDECDTLSDQERRFCSHYQATRAIAASIRAAGINVKNPSATGRKLLAKPAVCRELHRLEQQARSEAGPEVQRELIRALMVIATADVTDYYDQDDEGKLRLVRLADLDPEAKLALAEIAQAEDTCKVKMTDRLRAMELLGRLLGLGSETIRAELIYGPDGDAAPRELAAAAINKALLAPGGSNT